MLTSKCKPTTFRRQLVPEDKTKPSPECRLGSKADIRAAAQIQRPTPDYSGLLFATRLPLPPSIRTNCQQSTTTTNCATFAPVGFLNFYAGDACSVAGYGLERCCCSRVIS